MSSRQPAPKRHTTAPKDPSVSSTCPAPAASTATRSGPAAARLAASSAHSAAGTAPRCHAQLPGRSPARAGAGVRPGWQPSAGAAGGTCETRLACRCPVTPPRGGAAALLPGVPGLECPIFLTSAASAASSAGLGVRNAMPCSDGAARTALAADTGSKNTGTPAPAAAAQASCRRRHCLHPRTAAKLQRLCNRSVRRAPRTAMVGERRLPSSSSARAERMAGKWRRTS